MKIALRCQRCRLHGSLCICSLIPRLETRTRLVLITHRYEDRKTTNTGRLGVECLVNSEVIVRGHEVAPTGEIQLDESVQPLLLFPYEEARPLTDYVHSTRPVTLIVPDGTWRQASKVRQRVPGLARVPCVVLPAMQPSTYRLRSEPRQDGLATIEAIARAMGILEGEHVRRAMEDVFRAMVERTLWARGHIDDHEVASAIPTGVKRHDPASGETGAAIAATARPRIKRARSPLDRRG